MAVALRRWSLTTLSIVLLCAASAADAAHTPRKMRVDQQSFGRGERLEGVEPGSAAARAGLAPGDVVLSINGQPVGNFSDIGRIIAASGGRPVVLQVRRNGIIVGVIAHAHNGVLGVSKWVPSVGPGNCDWRCETFIAPPPIPPTPPPPDSPHPQ